MRSSNQKGKKFEFQVEKVLKKVVNEHPEYAYLASQPNIQLQNKEIFIPDFDFQILIGRERRCFFIECQSRKRFSKGLLHKIQYVRNKQWRKTFVFVYQKEPPFETALAYKDEGVILKSFEEFVEYIEGLRHSLCLHLEHSPSSHLTINDHLKPEDLHREIRERLKAGTAIPELIATLRDRGEIERDRRWPWHEEL